MKDYYKPLIKEESIEVSDIVANSCGNNKDFYESAKEAWVSAIILALPIILSIMFYILFRYLVRV